MLYKGDWKRDPQLSLCSPATRGIWIDLVCDMDDLQCATIKGTAAMLARTCRASADEVVAAIQELKASGAADVEIEGSIYSVTSRRMARDLHISDVRSKAVQTRYKTSTNEPTKDVLNAEDEIEDEVSAVVPRKAIKCDAKSIYEAYPRKLGRRSALKAIESAFNRLQGGECPDIEPDHAGSFLLDSARYFARSPGGKKGEFTPHPATWFNQSRYLDDRSEWNLVPTGGNNGAFKSKTESSLDAARQAQAFISARAQEERNRILAEQAWSPETGETGGGRLLTLRTGS